MLATFLAAFMLLAALPVERVEYLMGKMMEAGLTREESQTLLDDKRVEVYPPRVVQSKEIDWDKMIANLVRPASVKRGVEFQKNCRSALGKAEQRYGVDPDVLVGLIRLESNFGTYTGTHVTFNVFYTHFSQKEEEKRWKWAADNLAALAAYCKTSAGDCFEVKGSYGGAMGAAQFLPFSVIEWGTDGNGDEMVNPYDMEDAIVSAANFLVEHGWHDGHEAALGRYYGSSVGYPRAVLSYAEALREASEVGQIVTQELTASAAGNQ